MLKRPKSLQQAPSSAHLLFTPHWLEPLILPDIPDKSWPPTIGLVYTHHIIDKSKEDLKSILWCTESQYSDLRTLSQC